VAMLPRQPGTKESRYAHLLSGDVETFAAATAGSHPGSEQTDSGQPLNAVHDERLALLEGAVAQLRQEFADLKKKFEDLFA
jgi:uncharacterized protein